jgi:thiol-disulfide isomerase/thioredoxin
MNGNFIKSRWKKYLSRKSKWGVFFDFFFMALVIAMLIPSSRKVVSSTLIRYTMFQPRELKEIDYLSKDALDWKLMDSGGKVFTLKDLKGKVVFVNFWATWCPPCIAEMPSINKLYKQYAGKVVFLIISSEDPVVVRKFMNEKGYSFPLVSLADGSIPEELYSKSIPASFLISQEGRLVIKKTGAANWDGARVIKLIDSLLKKK